MSKQRIAAALAAAAFAVSLPQLPAATAWAAPTPATPGATATSSASASPATPSASPSSSSPTAAPSATDPNSDNPAVGGIGELGKDPQPTATPQARKGEATLASATKKDLGYDEAEFAKRGAAADKAGRAGNELKGKQGFSYLYQRPSDGATVIVGTGAAVQQKATEIGAVVDSAAYDPSVPDADTLKALLKQQVGLYGVSAIGYGTEGWVIAVDPGAQTTPGKKPIDDFAKQFKHVSVKRQVITANDAADIYGGQPYWGAGYNCTMAFNGYYNGAPAAITAGHCTDGRTGATIHPTIGGTFGHVDWSMWGGSQWGTDAAVITGISGWNQLPAIQTNTGGTVTITGTATPPAGSPVCKSGRTTQWTCGTIDFYGWIWGATGTISNGSWVWSGASQNVTVSYGDSGGAWVSGHKAVGITATTYDKLSYPTPVYKSSFAPVEDVVNKYRPGTEVKAWIGNVTQVNGQSTFGQVWLTKGQQVNGYVPPLSGDSWSPGSGVHIVIPESGQDFWTGLNPDGSFSFTYSGTAALPTMNFQAGWKSSAGDWTTFNGGPVQIPKKYADMGGAGGLLGNPVNQVTCGIAGGGCYQSFQGGLIYWSPSTGAHFIRGAIYNRYADLGYEHGNLGYPTTDEVCGLKDNGCYELFQGGAIQWTQATGAWDTWGALRDRYAQLGYEESKLGYPTGPEVCGTIKHGGCYQSYQGGALMWSQGTGAWENLGAIRARYAELNYESSQLGLPTGPETCGIKNDGCYQLFEGGAIVWSEKTGAWESEGALRNRYAEIGYESSALGLPTGPERCWLRDNGCAQSYEGGAMYWSQGSGAWESTGPIQQRYAALRAQDSQLGYPTGPQTCGIKDDGCYQLFQHGAIVWSAKTGAWESEGAIRDRYAELNYESGVLGLPTGAETCGLKDGGCSQTYQGGTVYWSQGSGAWESTGPIQQRYAALKAQDSDLGYPTGPQTCGIKDDGCYQLFQRGAIVWSAKTGAWESKGAIRDRYAALNYESSQLGLPTGGETCGIKNNGCYQTYEGGVILWSEKTGAWENWGEIRTQYLAKGGYDGSLGLPTGAIVVAGDKTSQTYEDGTLSV